jgi:hypothetical protein
MASITRAEYDALRLAASPIPKVDVFVEANGKRVDLRAQAADADPKRLQRLSRPPRPGRNGTRALRLHALRCVASGT